MLFISYLYSIIKCFKFYSVPQNKYPHLVKKVCEIFFIVYYFILKLM